MPSLTLFHVAALAVGFSVSGAVSAAEDVAEFSGRPPASIAAVKEKEITIYSEHYQVVPVTPKELELKTGDGQQEEPVNGLTCLEQVGCVP